MAWVSVPCIMGILQALLTALHLQTVMSALRLVIKPPGLAPMGEPGGIVPAMLPMATGADFEAYAAPSMPE